VADVVFRVDLGGTYLSAYNGGRGWFQVGIWPRPNRYYLLGISFDSRGRVTTSTVTTIAGGMTQVTQTQVLDPTSVLFTAMLGQVFDRRIELAVGALYGDGAGSIALHFGTAGSESQFVFRNDVYVRSAIGSIDDRVTFTVQPFKAAPLSGLYFRTGIESFRGVEGSGKLDYFLGGGLVFDDEDIKLLFSLK
jgi:hypothetical protein